MTPTGTRRSIDSRPGHDARHELAVGLERHRRRGVRSRRRRSSARGASCRGPRRSRAGSTSRTRGGAPRRSRPRGAGSRRAPGSSSRPRPAGRRRPRRRPRATSSGVDRGGSAGGRPVAGSRTSRGSPVPGCQSARNGSSQPAACGSRRIRRRRGHRDLLRAAGGRRPALRVGLRCAGRDGPLSGRRVAPDRAAGEHGVDQAFLEVGRVLPRPERRAPSGPG